VRFFLILNHCETRHASGRGTKRKKANPTVAEPLQNPISWVSRCQNRPGSRWPPG